MHVNRRHFLLTSALGTLVPACSSSRKGAIPAQSGPQSRHLDEALERALASAKRIGATYADARIVRRRWEHVVTREDHVVSVSSTESYGIGVRVLANGAWGFSAASQVAPEAAGQAAQRAVEMAKAHARAVGRPVELAPVPAYKDSWRTTMKRSPFDVPLAEKTEYLLALWSEASKVPGVKFGRGQIESLNEWKLFASTDGSRIEQEITRIGPTFSATAVDASTGDFESVDADIFPMQAGWEYVTSSSLRNNARHVAEQAVEKLKSPSVRPGKRDLVIAPSNLWLTIHESIGHSTELDRVLGYEANMAGTSFATIDKLNRLQYGTEILTMYADKTTPGALATCGYDDDGVKTQRWDIIRNGRLVGYQTTREQAAWIGEKASRGTSYAEDYKSFPFQRMPNISLAADKQERSIESLVGEVSDGVLVVGNASWSIDHQRYNFQFGAQMAYDIKNGKVANAVRDFAYQSNTIEFWHACDQLGGPHSWRLCGSLQDGKGEPMQSNAVSHGCPPARFRGINVLDTSEQRKSR